MAFSVRPKPTGQAREQQSCSYLRTDSSPPLETEPNGKHSESLFLPLFHALLTLWHIRWHYIAKLLAVAPRGRRTLAAFFLALALRACDTLPASASVVCPFAGENCCTCIECRVLLLSCAKTSSLSMLLAIVVTCTTDEVGRMLHIRGAFPPSISQRRYNTPSVDTAVAVEIRACKWGQK